MSNALLQERKQRYLDAINFKKTDRPVFCSHCFAWSILDSDSGITIEEATTDFSLQENIIREHLNRYEMDSTYQVFSGYNTKLLKILGGQPATVVRGNMHNMIDRIAIEEDEYDEYLKDPVIYLWKNLGTKFYPDLTLGQIQDGIKAIFEFGMYFGKSQEIQVNEFQIPLLFDSNRFYVPWGERIHTWRGMKGYGTDLRRHPDKIDAWLQIQREDAAPGFEHMMATQKSDLAILDTYMGVGMHGLMNKKQYERFIYPDLKAALDRYQEAGFRCHIMWEADVIRMADYIRDYSDVIVLHPEMEDVRDIRKVLPKMPIEGGIPLDLLGGKTPEQCADYVKKLIDDMGEGFILSQNKMMNYPADAKRENMLAVQNVIMNYR